MWASGAVTEGYRGPAHGPAIRANASPAWMQASQSHDPWRRDLQVDFFHHYLHIAAAMRDVKCASVYLRQSAYIVHSSSRTTHGFWSGSEPIIRLDSAVNDQALGDAIVKAIDASKIGVAAPEDPRSVLAPLLSVAGVKSWSAFSREAECVEVEADGLEMILIPTRKLGSSQGFQPLSSGWLSVAARDAAELGESAKRLLSAHNR